MANPPKPTALKRIEGTYRKDRAPKNEVQPTISMDIEAPTDLNEWGQKYWVDIMSEYSKVGLVTKVDIGALHSLCQWYGVFQEALDIVAVKGLEVEIERFSPKGEPFTVRDVNPMIGVADKAYKNYKMMCVEFGLTPASRTRISAPEKNENDKFAEFDK